MSRERVEVPTKLISLKLKTIDGADVILTRLLHDIGVIKISRLFPDETDPELATLYTVAAESSGSDLVLKKLAEDPDVEFAEFFPPRKLV